MAKATGLSSQFRGKVGNIVGYLTKNRAGRYEQTVKAYQPVVANPQTYAQALARVPVGPVQRICSALLPLVQRGWEGTAYGDPSKNEFLSYNLKYFRGPFMEKGSVMVPPGPMLITKGSLAPIGVREVNSHIDTGYIKFDLKIVDWDKDWDKGAMAEKLLESNPQLVPGEQLTFVVVYRINGEFFYRYESLYLNPNDKTFPRGILTWTEYIGGYLTIMGEEAPEGNEFAAGCCIRSQLYGESSFKRSTSFLTIAQDMYLYNDETAVRNAVASYRTGEDPEDWEDDPTPEYQKIAYLCMVDVTADMVIVPSGTTIPQIQCLGYVTKGGEMGIFYMYSEVYRKNVLLNAKAERLQWANGSSWVTPGYNSTYYPATEYSSIYGTM